MDFKYLVLGITVENFRPIGFLFREISIIKDFVNIGKLGKKLREFFFIKIAPIL